ncbi:MAG: hypothetical protein N2505_00305 [Endomicrobia bacterium]|nr:hypothetical protein [Endomicrobiia bacterium]
MTKKHVNSNQISFLKEEEEEIKTSEKNVANNDSNKFLNTNQNTEQNNNFISENINIVDNTIENNLSVNNTIDNNIQNNQSLLNDLEKNVQNQESLLNDDNSKLLKEKNQNKFFENKNYNNQNVEKNEKLHQNDLDSQNQESQSLLNNLENNIQNKQLQSDKQSFLDNNFDFTSDNESTNEREQTSKELNQNNTNNQCQDSQSLVNNLENNIQNKQLQSDKQSFLDNNFDFISDNELTNEEEKNNSCSNTSGLQSISNENNQQSSIFNTENFTQNINNNNSFLYFVAENENNNLSNKTPAIPIKDEEYEKIIQSTSLDNEIHCNNLNDVSDDILDKIIQDLQNITNTDSQNTSVGCGQGSPATIHTLIYSHAETLIKSIIKLINQENLGIGRQFGKGMRIVNKKRIPLTYNIDSQNSIFPFIKTSNPVGSYIWTILDTSGSMFSKVNYNVELMRFFSNVTIQGLYKIIASRTDNYRTKISFINTDYKEIDFLFVEEEPVFMIEYSKLTKIYKELISKVMKFSGSVGGGTLLSPALTSQFEFVLYKLYKLKVLQNSAPLKQYIEKTKQLKLNINKSIEPNAKHIFLLLTDGCIDQNFYTLFEGILNGLKILKDNNLLNIAIQNFEFIIISTNRIIQIDNNFIQDFKKITELQGKLITNEINIKIKEKEIKGLFQKFDLNINHDFIKIGYIATDQLSKLF